jgi:phosphoribosylglycinamide formyltransferase-1
MKKIRAAILISGRGSNMRSLIEAARDSSYPAEITCVVSNRANAPGLDYAVSQGIATSIIDHRAYDRREDFDRALDEYLARQGVELIALAGFMRILTSAFIGKWEGRLINIHPSLLPAYRGLHTHERALAEGAAIHGCTVHYVSTELDAGEIIAKAEVPVLEGDTPDILAARVLREEHRIYPPALAEVARRLQTLQAKTST